MPWKSCLSKTALILRQTPLTSFKAARVLPRVPWEYSAAGSKRHQVSFPGLVSLPTQQICQCQGSRIYLCSLPGKQVTVNQSPKSQEPLQPQANLAGHLPDRRHWKYNEALIHPLPRSGLLQSSAARSLLSRIFRALPSGWGWGEPTWGGQVTRDRIPTRGQRAANKQGSPRKSASLWISLLRAGFCIQWRLNSIWCWRNFFSIYIVWRSLLKGRLPFILFVSE